MSKTETISEKPHKIPDTPEGQGVLTKIHDFLSGHTGRLQWCIVTYHEGGYVFHARPNNPCMGDLRKYMEQDYKSGCRSASGFAQRVYESRGEVVKKTPPDLMGHKDYTDPYTGNPDEPSDDYYPTDLPWPFPLGAPVAVGVNLYCPQFTNDPEFLDFVLSSESPFRRGFDPSGEITVLKTKGNGLILNGLDLDPTVFVNLLNSSKNFTSPGNYGEFRKALTMPELLFMLYYGFGGGDGYYTPMSIDSRKFFSGESNDLTGGSLRDRYDYNRKIFHEVFGDVSIDVRSRTGDVSERYIKTKGIWGSQYPGSTPKSVQEVKDYISEIVEKTEKFYSKEI